MMVGGERVSVDDALISTDVDRLIRTISDKKRINIYELEKETGINRKTIDKWIHVLEDEGYIKIEYKFTNTFVVWLGAVSSEKEEEKEEYETESVDAEYSSPFKTGPLNETAPVPTNDTALERDVEAGPVEAVAKENTHSVSVNEVTRGDNDHIGEAASPALQVGGKAVETQIEEVDDMQAAKANVSEPAEAVEKRGIKELMNSYLDDISKQKTEIEKLKQEKERLYRNRFMALENKIEGDMVAITEKVLEKEGRILELKERILELPDKVDEVEKLHKTMEKIEKEGRAVIKTAKDKVGLFLEQIKKSEESVNQKIAEGKRIIEQEQAKVRQLEGIGTGIGARMDNIRATLDGTRSTMDELNESMREMLNQLEDATETKVEVSELTNRIRISVDKKEQELDALENELSEIKKVEQWIMEYVSDYENKIGEIEQYVKNSGEELDKIRETSEGEYIKRYLKELESLTNMYETELEYATAEEKGIDERMIEAKRRLNELVSESRIMIKRLNKEAGSLRDFRPAVKSTKDKTEKIKKMIEEKEKERDKLGEDITGRKTRKKSRGKRGR